MPEKRVTVWVQRFKDRAHLMLQWIDPDTGKRKSKSAGTDDEKQAETARADLEADLNHGRYQEASRMSWERFRELFEEEYAAGKRQATRDNFTAAFDLFERICQPGALKAITERTLSAFVAGLRKEPGRGGNETMVASTIKVRLEWHLRLILLVLNDPRQCRGRAGAQRPRPLSGWPSAGPAGGGPCAAGRAAFPP